MKIKPLVLTAAAIISLAAFLRLANLNSLPIFADEAIYVRWSQVMRAESSLRFLPLSDGKQPLFMWVTIPFLKVFTSDPLLAGRVLSALAGLGTIVGVGFAAYILFKNFRLAFLASLIYAVLPFTVFFDRLALSDSLLTLFYLWYFILISLTLTHSRLDLAMLGGFSLGFAWLTKSPAVFAIALSPSILLLQKHLTKSKLFVSCGLWVVAWIIAAAMFNILRLGPQFHMIAQRNRDYVFPLSEVLRHPQDPLISHLKDSFHFYLYLLTPLGLLFLLWGLADGQKVHLRQRLILVGWFLVPVLVQSFVAKGFTARYLLFTVPFAAILISHAAEHIGQRTSKHFLTYTAAGLVIAVSLAIDFLIIYSPQSAPLPRIERAGYLEEWTAGYGIKAASQTIRQAASTGQVVVGSEGFFGTPFDALQLYLNDVPNVRVVGVGIWIDSVPEKLATALNDNQVFLVVNSSRFYANPQNVPGLKLLAEYPKPRRPDTSRDSLLFFQVTK